MGVGDSARLSQCVCRLSSPSKNEYNVHVGWIFKISGGGGREERHKGKPAAKPVAKAVAEAVVIAVAEAVDKPVTVCLHFTLAMDISTWSHSHTSLVSWLHCFG